MNKHKEHKEYSLSKNKVWTIYKHTCVLNGYSYIGQTFYLNIYDRFGKNGINYSGTLFGDMILAIGWNNFTHEIPETNITSLEAANERECYWIDFYRRKSQHITKFAKRKVKYIETNEIFESITAGLHWEYVND